MKLYWLLLLSWGLCAKESALMKAAKDNDVAKVKQLIKQKTNVNEDDQSNEGHFLGGQGKTALMFAAQNGNVEITKLLIDAGANVNAVAGRDQPWMGSPVIAYAIKGKNVQAVQLLLEKGAHPNEFTSEKPLLLENGKGNRNLPILSYAIWDDAPSEIIQELIKAKKIDLNKQSLSGYWTPLMIAALKGNKKAVEMLLTAGADKTIKNQHDKNRTAYDYAKSCRNKEILNLLK